MNYMRELEERLETIRLAPSGVRRKMASKTAEGMRAQMKLWQIWEGPSCGPKLEKYQAYLDELDKLMMPDMKR